MSYAYTLDEYPESRLREELQRRENLQRRGLCDYCGRPSDTPTCKEHERHQAAQNGGTS